MMRCEQHNLPLVHIEGTVNNDPWVCAKCAYDTALSLSKELAAEQRKFAELQALFTVVCDVTNREREARL